MVHPTCGQRRMVYWMAAYWQWISRRSDVPYSSAYNNLTNPKLHYPEGHSKRRLSWILSLSGPEDHFRIRYDSSHLNLLEENAPCLDLRASLSTKSFIYRLIMAVTNNHLSKRLWLRIWAITVKAFLSARLGRLIVCSSPLHDYSIFKCYVDINDLMTDPGAYGELILLTVCTIIHFDWVHISLRFLCWSWLHSQYTQRDG